MKPGPTEIHQCPSCSNSLAKRTLLSFNSFGAKLYSDCKVISGMCPVFPIITICPNCKTIFWIEEKTLVGEYWHHTENEVWQDADYAEFLTIEESFIALERSVNATNSDEYFIRNHILLSFNDRIREGIYHAVVNKVRETAKLFNSDYERDLYENNIKSMINLLKTDTDKNTLMLAELNRNLGNFELCLELLASIDNLELDWKKKAMQYHCDNGNRQVFQYRS